ncbi:MAG TPA: hypothetical protein VGK70_06390 [Thermoanaerobaculia bacterium]
MTSLAHADQHPNQPADRYPSRELHPDASGIHADTGSHVVPTLSESRLLALGLLLAGLGYVLLRRSQG